MSTQHVFTGGSGGQGGFALIESLISFVVLAVGILALLSFHQQSQINIAEAKAQAEALAIAEAKRQELESFARFTFSSNEVSNDLESGGSETVDGVNVDTFNLNWTITDEANGIEDPGNPGVTLPCRENIVVGSCLKTVVVTVTWQDRNDEQQEVTTESEIHFHKPTEGPKRLISLLAATYDITASWQGGGGNPLADPESNLPDGAVAGKDVAEFAPEDIPDSYTDQVVYLYRVFVVGVYTGNRDIVTPLPSSSNSTSSLIASYFPGFTDSCTVDTGGAGGSFSCELHYLSLDSTGGYTGSISFRAASGQYLCVNGTAYPSSSSYQYPISPALNVTEGTRTYNGLHARSNTSCP